MKLRVVVTFLIVTFFNPVLIAGELNAVTQSWPLFVSRTDDGTQGRDWEIVKHILSEMGYELKVTFLPWKRCLAKVKNLEADLVIAVGKTEEREKEMFFSSEFVSICDWTFFFRKETEFSYKNIYSLEHMTVGTILGYHYGYEFNTNKNITRFDVLSTEQNLRMLVNNRVDLVIEDRNVGLKVIRELGLQDEITYTKHPIATSSPLYVAFSKKEGHHQLTEEFSRRLKEYKRSMDR